MADQSKKYKFDISNLNLHYGDFHALKDVNMQIEANKITAFIGPSGCGKSTLLKSINRMNDLVEGCKIDGEILLDGKDIFRDIDVNLLRKRVGMVFQKPNPFPMSIYDNIAYGNPKATKEEIIEAAKLAGAHEFILELKDGYDTYVGERGVKLSGGQKQRLCLARTIIKNPDIYIFDEATSNIDVESEEKIWESI